MNDMIWLQFMSGIFLRSPALLNRPYFTHHQHYLCTLPADNAENWITGWIPLWVTWLATNRKLFYFFPSPLKSKSLRLFTHSLFVLPPHSARLRSFHLCSLPVSDLHGRLPVYVRRALSQSAVKAVILLVAIYYPVVCLKKDWKRAKPGAGCWVSTHTATYSPQLTYILYISAFLFMKVRAHVCACMLLLSRECCCSLGEVFI